MIRRVLFATDGVVSVAAQRVAIDLAPRFRAKLTALNIVDAPWIMRPESRPIGTIDYGAASKAKQPERVRAQVRHVLTQLKKSAGGAIAIVTSAVEGDPRAVVLCDAGALVVERLSGGSFPCASMRSVRHERSANIVPACAGGFA